MKKLLVFGFGNLAYETIRILSSQIDVNIYIVSRNFHSIKNKFNHLILINSHINKYPNIQFIEGDINNTDQISVILDRIQPDYIFQTAPLRASWKNSLSNKSQIINSILPGAWYPFLAPYTIKLMRILNSISIDAVVINACYPDVTNPVLERYNLSPDIGIGNIANSVPAIRYSIADLYNLDPSEIILKVAGHHGASYPITKTGTTLGAPILIKAKYKGDILDIETRKSEVLLNTYNKFQRLSGLEGQTMTAHSAALVLLYKFGTNIKGVHAPGFNGLEGGYPINTETNDIDYDTEDELKEMIQVNLDGQKYDGIDYIDSEGTVHFTDECQNKVKDVLGIDLKTCKINEVDEVGKEMSSLLDSL